MLNRFNQELNNIIFESYNISPKYIDKDFQGTYNNIDLFTSKTFFKGISRETFIAPEFIKLLLNKLNLNVIKEETSVIIYIPKFSFVFTGIITPKFSNRYELILLNSWKSDKVPHIETTGQIRIIL